MAIFAQKPRSEVANHGTFLSVQGAFDGADDGLKNAVKMEFSSTVYKPQSKKFTFQQNFSTDRMLLDFGAVSPNSIDLSKIERDCDLIKEMVQKHPDTLRDLVAAVTGKDGGEPARILKTAEALRKIGLTEKSAAEQGGGILALLVLAAAAMFAAGAQSCTTHGTAGRRPSSSP